MTQSPDLKEVFDAAFEKALRKLGKINVLIAGRTGVGKSTLINSIFHGNMAVTGQRQAGHTDDVPHPKGRHPSLDLGHAWSAGGPRLRFRGPQPNRPMRSPTPTKRGKRAYFRNPG